MNLNDNNATNHSKHEEDDENDKHGQQNNGGEKEKVTITVAHPFGDDIFENRYGTIQEKLDHINLEMVYFDGSADGLEELFAKDIIPDIFNTGNVEMLMDYDAIIPLDDLIEKHGFDTSIIQPSLIRFLTSYDREQSMIGIPDGASYYALFYNKEVFDLFGEPYPDPAVPMTWNEVFDLGRKLTAEQNGEQYIGLEFHGNDLAAPFRQLGINLTDPESGEVLLHQRDEVGKYLNLVEEYYNIPGIKDPDIISTCMMCEGRAAMSISWHGLFLWGELGTEPEEVEKFDIAPVPVWPDLPDVGPSLASWPIMVSSYSEHPDEAFEVLMEYLSEENQLRMASTVSAGPTTLYPTVLESLGAEHKLYQGKNLSAITILEPAVGEERRSAKWDNFVNLNSAVVQLRESNDDVPTIIRKLAEESAAKISEAKARE